MNRSDIEALLPHREPFLMVDRVEEMEPGVRAVAFKDVRDDEFWCKGHFPGNPILPGVLISEALAQVAALIHLAANQDRAKAEVYLVGMDKMRFRRPVRPGDCLRLEVEATGNRRGIYQFAATASVDGQRVANGQFMAAVAQE